MRKILTALCLAPLLLCGCPSDLSEALRQYGYAPVRPASQLWKPGTMIYLRSREPFEVGVLCTAEQMLGRGYRPMESLTTNADLAKASKRGVTIAANVQDIVSADADLQAVKSVKVHLRNVKIYEVSDYDIQEGTRRTDPACLRAIMRRRRQGFEVTMIAASLAADVSYTVNWTRDSNLNLEAKVAAVQNLSAKLGVEAQSSSDKSIEANGLIWGIRDDAFLAYLFDPAHCPQVRPNSQLLDPQAVDAMTVVATPPARSPLAGASFEVSADTDGVTDTGDDDATGQDQPGTSPPLDAVGDPNVPAAMAWDSNGLAGPVDAGDGNGFVGTDGVGDGNALAPVSPASSMLLPSFDGAGGAALDQNTAGASSGGVGGNPNTGGADTVRAADGRRTARVSEPNRTLRGGAGKGSRASWAL